MGGVRNERGFTLIELIMVMALTAVMLTLGASAFRNFWLTHTLDGSADEVVSQLRRVQARTTSESNPLVYGVRFRHGSSEWDVVRFDPRDDSCVFEDRNTMTGGSFSADVVVLDPSFNVAADAPELLTCRDQLSGVTTADRFVFFYARGTATHGTLKLHQPNLGSSKDRTVSVTGLTGRATRS